MMVSKAINTSATQARTPEFSEKEGVVALTDVSIAQFFEDLPDPEKFKEFYNQWFNAALLLTKYNNKLQGEDVLKETLETIESKGLERHKAIDTYVEGKNVDELTLLEHALHVKMQVIGKLFKKQIGQMERSHAQAFNTLFLLLESLITICSEKKNALVSTIEKLNTLYNTNLFETLGMYYHPDRLNEATLRKIYAAAEKVLSRFENLPTLAKENGINMPGSAVYDGSKRGGFLIIYQALAPKTDHDLSGAVTIQHQKSEKIGSAKIGEILSQEDPQRGSKEIKYQAYADKKCESLIFEPHQILSGKTAFGIEGGVRIKYKGGFLRIGFSGRSQADDLGMVVAPLYKAGVLNKEAVQEIQAIAQSPYLEEKMFSLLTQD